MPIVWSPPVDSTSDVVYNRGVESLSVIMHYALMALMGDVHNRRGDSQSVVELNFALLTSKGGVHRGREDFCQNGLCFNGCEHSMLRWTMWLQANWKERWSSLKLMRTWCWRRRPPDLRWRSSEEMGGHPFKHGRKKKILRKFNRFS